MAFLSFSTKSASNQKTEDKIPHERTATRISVDESEAMKSSLAELGNGIRLTGELKEKFLEMVLSKEA